MTGSFISYLVTFKNVGTSHIIFLLLFQLLPSSVPVGKISASQVELRLALFSLYTRPNHPPGQVYLSLFLATFDDEIWYGSFKQQNNVN